MFGEDAHPPARVRVKICGITNPADAEAAIAAGADALGFNGYRKSKRYLDLVAAAPWIEALPANVRRVVVLVDPSWEEALATAEQPFVSALQLHGNESAEFCARLAGRGIRFGKALRALAPDLLLTAAQFSTQTIVLDSAAGDLFGGTGEIFPWSLAQEFSRDARKFAACPRRRFDSRKCRGCRAHRAPICGRCDHGRRGESGPERSCAFARFHRRCARGLVLHFLLVRKSLEKAGLHPALKAAAVHQSPSQLCPLVLNFSSAE